MTSPSNLENCENCARPDADLATVQRVYLLASPSETPVVPSTGGANGEPDPIDLATLTALRQGDAVQQILDDIERWCPSCRSQYLHVAVTGQ